MGLAPVDPHSHKVQTKLHKILKFGVSRPKSKQDTAILTPKSLLEGRCPRNPGAATAITTPRH